MIDETEGTNALNNLVNNLRSAYLEDVKRHYKKNGIELTDEEVMQVYKKNLDTMVYFAHKKEKPAKDSLDDTLPQQEY